jgi:hypothetical protein
MGWDLFAVKLPDSVKSTDDLRDDFKPEPIGTRAEIISAIREFVPAADFTDPAFGSIEGETFGMNVGLGGEEPLTTFALHVHGTGDEAVALVTAIFERLGVRAFDPSSETGIFVPGPDAKQSFQRWQAYRDRVISNPTVR